MENKILELEKTLFKLEYMQNKNYLEEIIADNYLEIGKSGFFFSKSDVIEELIKLKEDRPIIIYNYTCEKVDNNTWLIHYITKNNNENIYRTSIWQRENDKFRILFHQASIIKEKVNLIEY